MFMLWANAVTFYMLLFYAYFPFAMLAQEVHNVTKRYA
jgi:hypothetical protein